MRRWWHNRRYTNCDVCGKEFRKGHGSGMSGRVVCSLTCYQVAWYMWFRSAKKV